jgi:hypothetical protein
MARTLAGEWMGLMILVFTLGFTIVTSPGYHAWS